jgi:hypothetical protein
MLELHVVVAVVIMSNILELFIKIVPNYPTGFPGVASLANRRTPPIHQPVTHRSSPRP